VPPELFMKGLQLEEAWASTGHANLFIGMTRIVSPRLLHFYYTWVLLLAERGLDGDH
jgi:hypothetical protein